MDKLLVSDVIKGLVQLSVRVENSVSLDLVLHQNMIKWNWAVVVKAGDLLKTAITHCNVIINKGLFCKLLVNEKHVFIVL